MSRGINIFAAVILGFVLMIVLGFLFLMLPQSSSSGRWTPPLTALFTAVSAVSDAGLAVVETGTYWSRFGQAVVLALIQLGGLGFMTIASFLLLLARRWVLFRDFRVSDALGADNARDFVGLLFWTVGITVVVEAAGTYALAVSLKEEGVPGYPWWSATFHTISAFNNAGFDILGDGTSLARYAGDARVLGIMAGLSFLGALSAPVIIGLVAMIGRGRLGADAKLAIATTVGLTVGGAALIFLMESQNAATMGSLDVRRQVMNAVFTSVDARSTGFASFNMGDMTFQALFVVAALMFIGGVSGSTAGGIKVNTFSVLWLTALAFIRGRRHVDVFQERVAETQIHKAVAVVFFAVVLVVVVALTLSATESASFRDLLFETVSAFGTVGFSTGITSTLSATGEWLIMATMFAGRLGPLTVALALAESRGVEEEERPEADVRVG